MNRYLITTADERSWVFDRPVLFLGEWCRRYNRKHIWATMDAMVVEPYGLEPSQKKHDLDFVSDLTEQLLVELTVALNAFHQTHHSEKYWNIVLGHWLRRYVMVAYNRYQTVTEALRNYKIDGSTIYDSTHYSLATTDSNSFVWAWSDDQWNHVLYSKILSSIGCIELHVDPAPLIGVSGFCRKQENNNTKLNIKKIARFCVKNTCNRLGKSTDAFIINSYLPLAEEIKLNLCLGQLPKFWNSPEFSRVGPDVKQRVNLKVEYKMGSGVEQFIRQHIIDVIPSCYVEGYNCLIDVIDSLPWPKKPKFIFTSNNFDTDEVFKVWTAANVEAKTPYYVGQHGNNYGTLLGMEKSPELTTCDKFITWGWHNNSDQHIPAFIFKKAGQKKGRYDPKGGLMLVELHLPHRLGPSDDYYEFGLYYNEQFRFVKRLPKRIHEQLTVRLHHNFKDLPWYDEQRWFDNSPNTTIEACNAPIDNLIANSRLIVHSYDSTGILETLSMNIPTLCFWRNEFEHLIPNAKPYYHLLKKAGIFQESSEKAADFIAKYWDHLNDWWFSPDVQKAKNEFCEQYARMEKSPVKILKRVFRA